MKKKISYIIGLLVLLFGVGTYAFAQNNIADKISAVTSAPPAQTEPVTKDAPDSAQSDSQAVQQVSIESVSPLVIVSNPNTYLNKKAKVKEIG